MADDRDVSAGRSRWRVLRERSKVAAVPSLTDDRGERVAVALHDAKRRRELLLDNKEPLVVYAWVDLDLLIASDDPLLLNRFALHDRITDLPDQALARREAGSDTALRPCRIDCAESV